MAQASLGKHQADHAKTKGNGVGHGYGLISVCDPEFTKDEPSV